MKIKYLDRNQCETMHRVPLLFHHFRRKWAGNRKFGYLNAEILGKYLVALSTALGGK